MTCYIDAIRSHGECELVYTSMCMRVPTDTQTTALAHLCMVEKRKATPSSASLEDGELPSVDPTLPVAPVAGRERTVSHLAPTKIEVSKNEAGVYLIDEGSRRKLERCYFVAQCAVPFMLDFLAFQYSPLQAFSCSHVLQIEVVGVMHES